MKRLLVVTLLTLMMLTSVALTAQNTMFKFNQDGEFASFSQSTDPSSSVNFSVSRNFSTGAGTSASINYLSFNFSPDFSILTIVQIVGQIPASAFTGQNTQNLSLNLDMSQLDPATSLSQTCTLDVIAFIITCDVGPSGSMQLNFSQNGAQRTRILALGEEITVGNFTTRVHQRSDNSSANYSGTIFGLSVSGSNATVGINHNSSLEFVKNHP
jgi:hypothetical protein